jgi:Carboxypeptidase regulatory-like domain
MSGDVTGTVLDASGAGIPNATVIATNISTGVKTPAETNDQGVYRFNNLLVGNYSVTASAKGFSTDKLENVEVVLNNVITANLTLAVGGTATTVEVSAGAAQIDTTTAQLQTSFGTKDVIDLPATASNSGSGIYNLSLLGSGVASSGGIGQGFGPVIAGQRPDNNSFNLDGISNNSYYDPAPIVYVSNEAIGEFTLLQNQFAPEFGGGSGGIFNAVVKSGTNQIHGDIYEYLLNRDLDAVSSQSAANGVYSNPRYDNNRLGATIGGPIIKNKLFYFGNFEYNPIGSAAQPGAPFYTPTAAGYAMLNNIAGLSQTNLQQMEKYLPAAPVNDQGTISVLGRDIPIGTFSAVSPSYTNNYDAVVAIDYNMSDKDQIRGRWIYNKSSTLDVQFAGIPAFNVFAPNNNYMYNMSEFHNFAPTLQNEFRVSYSRNVNSLPNATPQFPGLAAYPVLTIDELGANWGNPGASGSTQGLFQVQDNMTKVIGRNTIKFGGNFIDMIATNYFIQRVTGNYEYSTTELYLTDQAPDVLGERSAGATSYPVGFLQSAAFVNDDFRIMPNLTLNIGLRYEYVTVPVASRYQDQSAPASVYGSYTFARPFYNADNLMPRLGFAYSPGKAGEWSIRGGFAKAYDLTYSNLTANAAPPYFQQTNDCPGVNCAPVGFLASGGLPGNSVPLPTDQFGALAAVSSYTYGGKRPYGLTWNIGIQHVFLKNYTFEARYVGTRGVHLWNQTRGNIAPLVSPSNYIPTFLTVPSPATLAGLSKTLGDIRNTIVPGGTPDTPTNMLGVYGSDANIVGYSPQSNSLYNGLALQLNRRFSNGLTFIAAYTWSHAEDDASATNFSTYLTPRRAQNFQDLIADWSNSAFDHRQRFTFTPIYDVTVFKDKNWLLKNVVGNWVVSGTYTYETPEYATIQSGIDSNLNGDSAGDRTIINPAGSANIGSGVTAYNAAGSVVPFNSPSTVAYVANNSNARYIEAGYGALANGGRNSFGLRPIDNIDVQLKKNFNITERFALSVGAQFYNIFNHPQWTGGSINDVGSFGFTNSRLFLQPQESVFQDVSLYLNSNSRVVQVFAKFTF